MGGLASKVAIPFEVRPEARLGWVLASLATLGASVAAAWALFGLREGAWAFAVSGLLAWLYWEAGVGSFRMAWHTGKVEMDESDLVISHPFLLSEPLRVSRRVIAGFAADPRSESERRVAACTRRKPFGGPLFLEADLPVISPHPSSHTRYGTAAAPNFVILFHEEIQPPRVPLPARVLLRLAAGKSDRYRGPRPKHPMRGVRLLVEDPSTLAGSLGAVGIAPVDQQTYLRSISKLEIKRYRRERFIYAMVWVAVLGLLALARFVGWS